MVRGKGLLINSCDLQSWVSESTFSINKLKLSVYNDLEKNRVHIPDSHCCRGSYLITKIQFSHTIQLFLWSGCLVTNNTSNMLVDLPRTVWLVSEDRIWTEVISTTSGLRHLRSQCASILLFFSNKPAREDSKSPKVCWRHQHRTELDP